ncbi:MAG: LysR family transcriptional regulator [Xanthomonadales bacterium]|nr:LysR family transcriptional regulator [Xanthomonadales bacterium]MCB1634375.1 LysR family transcriptional regulator [Xanthomonadales bacterium]
MNLRDLRYLVALDGHRHFGRAAEASFVSQPTLSTQLKKLEDELGVQLIERGTPVMLTEVGEAIVERAREVLREVEQIREEARRHRDPEAGSLRLGMFPTLGPYLLPHVMPVLRKRFPQLELYLVEEKTEVLLQMLQRGDLDAAILALPIDGHAALEQTVLFDEPFVLALPADQPPPRHLPVPMPELKAQSLLLLEEGHCLRDQALEVCARVGARERSGFRATSLETLRQMVAAGVGMTLLPVLSVKPPVAPNPSLQLLPFEAPAPKRTLGLLWRKQSARSKLMPALAEALRELPQGLLQTADLGEASVGVG